MAVRGPRGQLLAMAMAASLTIPGIALRIAGAHPTPWIAAIVYGLAVVGSAFVLAWAAEALQLDVSQGLAMAVLALIAVLPEYAVDFVFTWKAGKDPTEYAPLALANMTGGNRLLIGVGWSMVVLLAAWRMRRIAKADGYTGPIDDDVKLGRSHSIEIAFLAVATLYSLTLPLKRTLALFDAVVLISLFVAYMVRVARAPAEEPHLVGPAELIGSLPRTRRRIVVGTMLVFAAGVILLCAEGFAEALVETGSEFGISKFLLVQWLAPLASEAPELLIAGLFAWRLNSEAGLGALVSSKVNQWTLLVGSLPIVFAIASRSLHGLPIEGVQRLELLLTGAQSLCAVALIVNLRMSVREAWWIFALFWAQFILSAAAGPELHDEVLLVTSEIYLVIAVWLLFQHRVAAKQLLRDGIRAPYEELTRP